MRRPCRAGQPGLAVSEVPVAGKGACWQRFCLPRPRRTRRRPPAPEACLGTNCALQMACLTCPGATSMILALRASMEGMGGLRLPCSGGEPTITAAGGPAATMLQG